MNNTLDIKRLAKLIVYENKSSRYVVNITIAIVCLAAFTLIIRLTENAIAPRNSILLISNGIIEAIITISPIIFYYKLMTTRHRTLYPTLPASNMEKYLSMLVNTLIVAPVTIKIVATTINSIGNLFIPFSADSITDNTISLRGFLFTVVSYWSIISSSMYLLIIFTQSKVWKAIAVTIGIAVIEILFMGLLISNLEGEYVSPTSIVKIWFIFATANLVIFQTLIYHAIKRIKA